MAATTIIVHDRTHRPYLGYTFRHDFAALRDKVAQGWDDGAGPVAGTPRFADPYFVAPDGGPLEIEAADLWFLDLRRTMVVWLAEAGSTEAEVAAITGHLIDRVRTILETYLPRTGTMAASAISKLEYARARRGEG